MDKLNELSEKWSSLKSDTADRIEELRNKVMMNELIEQKTENEKIRRIILITLAALAIVAFIAGVSFAVYKFLSRDYLEDYDDDFDDDFLTDEDEEDAKPAED